MWSNQHFLKQLVHSVNNNATFRTKYVPRISDCQKARDGTAVQRIIWGEGKISLAMLNIFHECTLEAISRQQNTGSFQQLFSVTRCPLCGGERAAQTEASFCASQASLTHTGTADVTAASGLDWWSLAMSSKDQEKCLVPGSREINRQKKNRTEPKPALLVNLLHLKAKNETALPWKDIPVLLATAPCYLVFGWTN